jgi:archaellum component FlaG (FlaF/FlaG flagellin family)
LASLLVAASLAAACAQQPLEFNTIQLGRGLNADRSVKDFTTRFKPSDTIYVAVLTAGAGSGKVKARWLYAGRVVSEPERDVTYQGPASTEFHIQNTGGFPPGEYSVELFLDGKSIGSKSFRVETGDPRTQYTFPNTTPRR